MQSRRRKKRKEGTTSSRESTSKLTCSNCSHALPLDFFSKKQLRRRNFKGALCLRCVGRPLPVKNGPEAKKRTCSECGKHLPRDKYSKTQWFKATGECKACIKKKCRENIVRCQRCSLFTACSGFRYCRECYKATCRRCGSDLSEAGSCIRCLPGGVGYNRPEFRNPKSVVFDTHTFDLGSLTGLYNVVYISIDGGMARNVSSTAGGSLEISLPVHGEGDAIPCIAARGILKLSHPSFRDQCESIHSFCISGSVDHSGFYSPGSLAPSFISSHVHEVAPETTWHDPCGDLYTLHCEKVFGTHEEFKPTNHFPGKMKVIKECTALPLTLPMEKVRVQKRAKRTNRNSKRSMAAYKDVSGYRLCHHLRFPEDVGRLIRQYVTPLPFLHLMPGDLFLVAASMNVHGFWGENIIVARRH